MTRAEALRALAPLALTALAMGAAVALAPAAPLTSLVLQDLCAIGLAVGLALCALHASSGVKLSGAAAWLSFGAATAGVAFVWLAQPDRWAIPLQFLSLVALARTAGGAIGERVQHPGHVMPATIVAAAADWASVLSPEGVTKAVAQSERALATFALAAPVPGTAAITYVLGIGDLVVISLLLAVARSFNISRARVTASVAVALALAFIASAALAQPIPALVPIALVASAGVPAFRTLAPKDRKVAGFAVALAVGVVVLVALRS
ncbi:MAG: hypothetical protein IPM79_30290 [Polyangiaceae bacterium]|jgi:hypothetical protein|nr:hypothetical protein [Polyangiaceae bacterium]MBK8941776.1 hypothetical protein [Polyangiaceae bacterium]